MKPDLADLFTTADRDAYFAALADGPPVRKARYIDGSPVWLITGHAEARAALADPRLSSVPPDGSASGLPDDVAPYLMSTLGAYDPPDHTRLRTLAAKAFTARRVTRLRPRITEIAAEILDGLDGEVEFVADFAYPFPIQVICELLGVPLEDRALWRTAAADLGSSEPARFAAGARALVEYMRGLTAAKRAAPSDDLISALVTARDDDGDRLSEQETVALSLSLLIAGHETTVALISAAVAHILTRPGLTDRLRAEPEDIPGLVEEVLRHSGPAEIAVLRHTTAPMDIAGTTIPAGHAVQITYAAANHDPRSFTTPGHLDMDRTDNPHLAFGHGIHYCLGAALARAEADIALRELLARFSSIRLASDTITLRPGLARAIAALPVFVVR